MTEPNPVLGAPFIVSKVTIADADDQETTVTLSHEVISRSFQTRASDGHLVTEDVIHDLLYLPKTVPALNVCQAGPEEIHHLLLLARCQDTVVNGYRFEELFPSEAVTAFRDDKGEPLLGVRFASEEEEKESYLQLTTYRSGGRKDVTPRHTVNDQKRYLLFTVIPRFAVWLADCFSGLCIYERQIMAHQKTDSEKFCKGIKQAFKERGATQDA